MTRRDDDPVHAYLAEVLEADTSAPPFSATRSRLLGLRAGLDAAVTPPRWEALAAWRLLASNGLRARGAAGRAAWDRANALLARSLETAAPTSFALAQRLHAELQPEAQALRTEPVFAADERYLASEDVTEQLAELDRSLPAARDALERAFRAYVGIVTIHPFSNGNGRTARLLADHALMADAWLPLCFASPVASHVARTYGGPPRDATTAFAVFGEGVANAYGAVSANG